MKYQVTDNQTGKTLLIDWEGLSPPTDEDYDEIFASIAQPVSTAVDIGEPESAREGVTPQQLFEEPEPFAPISPTGAPRAPTQVAHQMPSGEVMAGPEHPGAIPGSEFQAATTAVDMGEPAVERPSFPITTPTGQRAPQEIFEAPGEEVPEVPQVERAKRFLERQTGGIALAESVVGKKASDIASSTWRLLEGTSTAVGDYLDAVGQLEFDPKIALEGFKRGFTESKVAGDWDKAIGTYTKALEGDLQAGDEIVKDIMGKAIDAYLLTSAVQSAAPGIVKLPSQAKRLAGRIKSDFDIATKQLKKLKLTEPELSNVKRAHGVWQETGRADLTQLTPRERQFYERFLQYANKKSGKALRSGEWEDYVYFWQKGKKVPRKKPEVPTPAAPKQPALLPEPPTGAARAQTLVESAPDPKVWQFKVGGRTQKRVTLTSQAKKLQAQDAKKGLAPRPMGSAVDDAYELMKEKVSGIESLPHFNEDIDKIFAPEVFETGTIKNYHLHGDEGASLYAWKGEDGTQKAVFIKEDLPNFGAFNETEGHDWTNDLNAMLQQRKQEFIQNDQRVLSATTDAEKAQAVIAALKDYKDDLDGIRIILSNGQEVAPGISMGVGLTPQSAEKALTDIPTTVGRNSIFVDKLAKNTYNIKDVPYTDHTESYYEAGLRSDKLNARYKEIQEQKATIPSREQPPDIRPRRGAEAVEGIAPARAAEATASSKPIKDILSSEGGAVYIPQAPKEIVNFLQKEFTSRGNLPQSVFDAKVKKEGWVNAELARIKDTVKDLEAGMKDAYGNRDFTDKEMEMLDTALKTSDFDDLPPQVRDPLQTMRRHVDNLSQHLIDSGIVEGSLADIILRNKGSYLTRAYKVHSDPDWAKKVPSDVRNIAKAHLRSEITSRAKNLSEDIQSKMDTLLGEKANIETELGLPAKPTTAIEERLLERRQEAERIYTNAENDLEKGVNEIKKETARIKGAYQRRLDKINEEKTKVWREKPVTGTREKQLKDKKARLEKKITKMTEESEEIGVEIEEIEDILDELQGDLADVIGKIELLPTNVPDIGDALAAFTGKITNIGSKLYKRGIVEAGKISALAKGLEKRLYNQLHQANKIKTKTWREIKGDVIPGLPPEERIKAIEERIDQLNKRKEIADQRQEISEDEIEGMINELLYVEKGPIGILSKGSKLGAKNLGILKRRKQIAPEIRALWGEYKRPDVNYALSVARMANLVANHNFLTEVKDLGVGKFLRPPQDGPSKEMYVKLSSEGSPAMKPLDGYYTTPEIKEAFEAAVAPDGPSSTALKWYMRGVGVVKYSKTILSPMTHVRNLVGNIGFAVANGHFDITKMPKAIAATTKDTKAFREYRYRLIKLGVIGESTRAGELRDVLKDAQAGGMEAIIDRKYKKIAKGVAKAPEKAYAAEDDVWKMYAFENERERYRKAYPEWTDQQLDEHAAQLVRNTYPTYSMVPEAVKKVRKVPFVGTFVSFPAEVMRTAKNTAATITEELKNPRTRKIGAKRLAGLIAAAAGTAGVAYVGRKANGITIEKDRAIRTFVPPWDQNSQLIYIGRGEQPYEYKYINLGYTDPYSYLKDPVIALMRGESYVKAAGEAVGEIFEPFISEDIFTQKVIDFLRNKHKNGGQVYNEQDTGANIAKDVAAHFADGLEPGLISSGRRVYKGAKGVESPSGKVYKVGDELAAVATGFRINTVDVSKSLPYKAYEFQRNKIAASALKRKRGPEAALNALMINYDRMNKAANDAILLGMQPKHVVRILVASGIPKEDAGPIVSGKYREMVEEKYAEEKVEAEMAAKKTQRKEMMQPKPVKKYKIRDAQTGQEKVIEWEGDIPPTGEEIGKYFNEGGNR